MQTDAHTDTHTHIHTREQVHAHAKLDMEVWGSVSPTLCYEIGFLRVGYVPECLLVI